MDNQEDPKNPFEDIGEGAQPAKGCRQRPPLSEHELDLLKGLASQGFTGSEIARRLQRDPATISRALKKLNISKAVALNAGPMIVQKKLNSAIDLRTIHDQALDLITTIKVASKEDAAKYGFLLLKAFEAVRKDIELQLKICEALYNAESVARWQNELLDILGEIDPDARERFYRKYNERQPV